MAVFEIVRRADGYGYRLKANNHEIILSGEGYISKAGVENGIQSVKQHAPYDAYYHRFNDVRGEYRYSLLAANNQVIGVSEGYKTAYGRDNGVEAVKREAPSALVVDQT